jgi:hypothetical protein
MTSTQRDKELRDGDSDSDDLSAPAWAVHNPPRPAQDTLARHIGGGEIHVRQHTHAAHKATAKTKSIHVKVARHQSPSNSEAKTGGETIEVEHAGGRVEYQVVIDKVGHGVAPDQPKLVPTAALSFASVDNGDLKEADVQSAAQLEWQWKRRDSIELGLVGAAVLLVAAVVIAVARRQQRAYERQQQQQQQQLTAAAVASLDLEGSGALRFDTSGIRPTRDDDEVGTPESVSEGVV